MSNKVLLKNLVKIDSGFAFKSSLFTEDEQYIPIIRIRDVNSGVATTYYSGEYDEKYIVNNGDLLISMDGSFIIKKWTGGKALLNQRVCRIKSISDKITDDYLFRILPKELKVIEDKTPFVTVKHLSVKSIENIEINLPNLETQNKIVEVLDKAKDLIDKRKKQLDTLDELVKSRFIEMFGDPIKNPKNLEKVYLKDISELITKGSSPNWQGIEYVEDESQTLFVTSENVREGYLDLSKKKYLMDEFNDKQKRSILKNGDFLINIVGASIGRAAQFNLDTKANINQAVALVRIKTGLINDKYLLTYLNSPKALAMYESMKVSVARANLSLKNINELEILLPPIELQNQFADFVNQVDKLKSQMETSLKELEDNFNSLMQKAFKGELF